MPGHLGYFLIGAASEPTLIASSLHRASV